MTNHRHNGPPRRTIGGQRGPIGKKRRRHGPPPGPKRQRVLDGHRRVLNRATPGEKAAARAWLMKRGQVPTDAAVATVVAEAHRAEQFVAWKLATERDIDQVGRRAADLIALALASCGVAPTWRELGQPMGWRFFRQRVWVVPLLEEAGWLTTGDEPRSLRPGPKTRQP